MKHYLYLLCTLPKSIHLPRSELFHKWNACENDWNETKLGQEMVRRERFDNVNFFIILTLKDCIKFSAWEDLFIWRGAETCQIDRAKNGLNPFFIKKLVRALFQKMPKHPREGCCAFAGLRATNAQYSEFFVITNENQIANIKQVRRVRLAGLGASVAAIENF